MADGRPFSLVTRHHSLYVKQNLLGLFELDPSGKVLYFRSEPPVCSDDLRPDLTGRHFFDEVASFENADELRRRIGSFTSSPVHAANFNFTCRFANGLLPVRVLLARIRERANDLQTRSVLVHIREAR
ncbi:MAG: hypothetical protein ACRD9R_07175 [Pyrinomonadaceae bacterium]